MTTASEFLRSERWNGLLAGLGAFLCWGSLVLYWRPLSHIPATEVLAHRIFWSLITITPFVWYTGRGKEIRAALRSPGLMGRIAVSAVMVAGNWGLYIWAVTHGRVLESSLGYYINPLVNVLLGGLFLRERLTRLQGAAVALAAIGVSWSVLGYGQVPWVSLLLALSFALYGFCRKTVAVESAPGLFLEALLLFPLAAGWLAWLSHTGQSHFETSGLSVQLLLAGSGLVTTVPLMLFAYAARHMKLTTLGLLQYLSPTITFLLGIYIFQEAVTPAALVTFGCIWAGLALYTWCGLRQLRGHHR